MNDPGTQQHDAERAAAEGRLSGDRATATPGEIISATLPGGGTGEIKVIQVADGLVHLGYPGSDYSLAAVPEEAFGHFRDDLELRVGWEATSSDPAVNALARGEGTYLGKGNDGIVFRVGDEAVKVSTLVPYIPLNFRPEMTVDESIDRLEQQTALSGQMLAAGVPGILPARFVRHGRKGFAIRPYVEIADRLSRDELDLIQTGVLAMHDRGFVLCDRLQVGRRDSRLFIFDTGSARTLEGLSLMSRHDCVDMDIFHLGLFYEQHGCRFVALGGRALEDSWQRHVRLRPSARLLCDAWARRRELAHATWAAATLRAAIGRSPLPAAESASALSKLDAEAAGVLAALAAPVAEPAMGPPPPHCLALTEYVSARLAAGTPSPAASARRAGAFEREWATAVLAAATFDPFAVSAANAIAYETGRRRGSIAGPRLPELTMSQLTDQERAALADITGAATARTPYTVDEHREIAARLAKGEVGACEIADLFERLVASRASIIAELDSRPIEQLAPNGTGGRSKPDVVGDIFKRMLCRFAGGSVQPRGPEEEIIAGVRAITRDLVARERRPPPHARLGDRSPGGPAPADSTDPVAEDALFVALPSDRRLSREEFAEVAAGARENNGRYMSGQSRGFAFPTAGDAASFRTRAAQLLDAVQPRAPGPSPSTVTAAAPEPVPVAPSPQGETYGAVDQQLLDRLASEAQSRQSAAGLAWADAVVFPHPRLEAADIGAVTEAAGPQVADLARRVRAAFDWAGANASGRLPKAALDDVRDLVTAVRAKVPDLPALHRIEDELHAASRLQELGISEARLPGVLAHRLVSLGTARPAARDSTSVQIEVPLGFLVSASVAPDGARDGEPEIVTIDGEATLVSGVAAVERAIAGGLCAMQAIVDDGAIPALRAFEQGLVTDRQQLPARLQAGTEPHR